MRKLLIVIVLYGCKLEESLTYNSMSDSSPWFLKDNKLLIYNNSPDINISDKDDLFVVNSIDNVKLSGAYNYALNYATLNDFDYMLLLDQDTEITSEFTFLLANKLTELRNENIGAIVPKLKMRHKHLSPICFSSTFGPFLSYKPIHCYDSGKCISAYNSGTTINVKYMKSIGGFDIKYPLDMLDHSYFFEMYKAQKEIFILDTYLEQNLSLLDDNNQMSDLRYESYISSMISFSKDIGVYANIACRLMILKMIIGQLIHPKRMQYLKYSLYYLFV